MKLSLLSLASLATAATATAAAAAVSVYDPSEPWSTLTPDSPVPTDAIVNYTSTFGIAPVKITNSAELSSISAQSSGKTTSDYPTGTLSSLSPSQSAAYIKQKTAKTDSALQLVLNNTVLTDAQHRIGSIVANRQFQFDGPPPQAGTIYAAGWSISKNGNLQIGSNEVFYQCLSGTFYNLYDESLGSHCTPIHLEIVAFE